jgi:peptidoglycan/LPS O-acetylase OafA/YrhL
MNPFLVTKPFDFQFNAFDFIRLLLSILVIVSHSSGIGNFGFELVVKMRDWEIGFTSLGTFAVYGFFVISGFLVTRSWHRSQSAQDFIVKRLKRIYPGFLVSLLFSGLVFVPLFYVLTQGFELARFFKVYSKEAVQYIIQNVFVEIRKAGITGLTSDLKGGYLGVNGPYWSLIHEVRAYGLVLIFGYLGWLRKKPLAISLAAILNLIYFVCSLDFVLTIFNKNLHFRDLITRYLADYHIFILFTYFIFGMLFYIFHQQIIWNKWIYTLSILGLIVGWKLDIFPIFAPTCFTYSVLYSSQILPFRSIAKRIGDLSYGIYIYSWPIQLCLLYLGLNRITGNKYFDYLYFASLSIMLSILAGYLSWHFVEKRYLVRKI